MYRVQNLECSQERKQNQLVERGLRTEQEQRIGMSVLIANGEGLVFTPNPAEVMAYRWWSTAELALQLQQAPQLFTAWFAQVLDLAEQTYR